MRILLTGASGLIGRTVRDVAAERGIDVVATDVNGTDNEIIPCDLRDQSAVAALFNGGKIDAVVHCGALSGPMMAEGDPRMMIDVNINGTVNLFEAARNVGVTHFVICSSISVYGDTGDGVVLDENMELNPTSVYGSSKIAIEALLSGYKAEYGFTGTCFRIGRIYGPYRGANCAIKEMIDHWKAGTPMSVTAPEGFKYHYIYSRDVAEALLEAAARKDIPANVYNLGSDEEVEMSEVISIASEALPGLEIALIEGPDIVPDVNYSFPSKRLATDLGFKAQYDLARGIRAYAQADA